MSQSFRSRHNNHYQQKQKHKVALVSVVLDEQNPIINAFQIYALELDEKHDRYERIVKISRDITIEAKRVIFLLHTIDARKSNCSKTLEEASQRLSKVIDVSFKSLAKELINQDPYQYRSAYSPGLQEFVEAYNFMEYFQCSRDGISSTISDWVALQKRMRYQLNETDLNHIEETQDKPDTNNIESKNMEFLVDPTEYILGLADITGELMRRCINSLGSGETNVCFETCKALQHFYTGYIRLNVHRCRELTRKIHTMRQSVLKSENVCYNVKVRGREAAKWGSVFESKTNEDLDEGFY